MILNIFIFLIGFVFLIKGADILIDGATSIAKKFRISELVIGLTIVAFGSSAPELVVNIISSITGNTDLAIGNILGSNISNTLLIIGVAAIIYPLAVTRGTVWKEIPLSLLAIIVVGIMANDQIIEGAVMPALTRIDGLILLAFFLIFIYYTMGITKVKGVERVTMKQYKMPISIVMIIGGLIGLTLGGNWIVDSAVYFATAFGVSQALIGLTIVAIGTSLPELAASAMAAYKKSPDIAVGNIVGSNIFNLLWILGVSATIKPLPFSATLNQDILMVVFVTLLLFMFMFLGERRVLQRKQGIAFIVIYVCYITYIIFRG